MTVSADYLAYVLDQLAQLKGVSSRRMFGGAGLYSDEWFFGLIADDVLYLRADDSNRADYTARGMAPFRPYADRPHLSMSYYEAPAEVLEDAAELVEWARRSVGVAMAAPAKPKARGTKRRVGRVKRLARVTTTREAVHVALQHYVRSRDYSAVLALHGSGGVAEGYDPKAARPSR